MNKLEQQISLLKSLIDGDTNLPGISKEASTLMWGFIILEMIQKRIIIKHCT